MPLLAGNRKDTRLQIDWRDCPSCRQSRLKRLLLWRYRGRHDGPVTQSWSHCLVIGPAAALRRNPGDIAVRILDVAGFAVNAILGIDDESRCCSLLHPFVDAGRA